MDYDALYGDVVDSIPKKAAEIQLPVLPDSAHISDMAKAVERDIFATYYKLMMADGTPPAIKKSCADALADRARGKPAQAVEHTGKVLFETLILRLTPEQPYVENNPDVPKLT